ncbi:DUF3050 domain-containing protein [Thermaurantimonas aggregans]|nr:DUF3050 domain-containing protein [Thermaurantimonas aggregans]
MNKNISALQQAIEPLRKEIIHHPAYSSIQTLDDLRTFMEYHVFAVWDFMSLLKALQNQLTCTSVPWLPIGDANTRFLINEIVVGEESDIDLDGVRKSHFEMYLDAMQQAGADVSTIYRFIELLKKGYNAEEALAHSEVPSEAAEFVRYTFEIIRSGKIHVLSAVFTFGREDLIPDMFLSIIQELQKKFPEEVSRFQYYIDRHIEVDGGHHSHLALEMTSQLCGDEQVKWQEAQDAVVKALEMRKKLWDGVYRCIINEKVIDLKV